MRIVKVVVWTNSRTVNGLQFFYAAEGSSEVVSGNKAVVENDDYQRLEWDLTQKYDYVKRIVCATSPQGCIDKVSFTSANGLKFNAGGKIATKNDITSLTNIPDESLSDKEKPICAYIGLITFVGNLKQVTACLPPFKFSPQQARSSRSPVVSLRSYRSI